MAVEARHLNIFTPHQLIGNREIMNAIEGNGGIYNGRIGYGSVPISGTTTTAETLFQMYNNNSVIVDSLVKNHHRQSTHATPMKDDSGLTFTLPPSAAVSRKRPRDNISMANPTTGYSKDFNRCSNNGSLSFFGEDISSQFILQQLDVDRLISQHMEKVRMEIEESRKRHSRKVIEAAEVGMMKRLRAKEEEIEKMGKVNWALEERVKSLYVENQIWRDLAQSNEATANALRSNLEMVLAQVKDVRTGCGGAGLDDAAGLTDDAESCCGSSGGSDDDGKDEVEGGWRTLAGGVGDRKVEKDKGHNSNTTPSTDKNSNNFGRCRKCGKGEACVLLLPCRHLCLCTLCGSSLHTCPICKSNQTASVHVNIS